MMEGGPYLSLALPGSDDDKALIMASASASPIAFARASHDNYMASLQQHQVDTRRTGLAVFKQEADSKQKFSNRVRTVSVETQGATHLNKIAALLAGHVLLYQGYAAQVTCGNKPTSTGCACPAKCSFDGVGPGGGESGGPVAAYSAGPSAGDPVNLGSGEENYSPEPDLKIYNPIGPSVSFGRQYRSLRPTADQYNSDDFGVGWSHSYNYAVYDTTIKAILRFPQGATTNSLNIQGNDAPTSGLSWDIVKNGTTIASSSSPNGWSASSNNGYYLNLTIPSGAAVGTGYEVRVKYTYYGYYTNFESSFFDVYASTSAAQVPQGQSASFYFTGSDAPGAGLTWDIIQNGTTIASSANTNQWSATQSSVTAPQLAQVGTYEVRYHVNQYQNLSAIFQVYAIDFNPKPGVRWIIEPNGSQIPVTAGAVPTAANPTVVCTLPAGYPMLVTWNYAQGMTCGYFVITDSSRTQLVTTTAAKLVGLTSSNGTGATAMIYVLGSVVDQSGNSIFFNYGAKGTGGFPMLSGITDKNGSALATFTRATDGTGNLLAINDRYNRTVAYHETAYATANVPYGYPQSYQEVDHVSQIVATGTSNPPDRYAYGYQDVANGEGAEQVPFLHTITVPSPTGAGNATATINYMTDGTCYVASLVDANGNSRNYSATDLSHTLVTVKNPQGTAIYSYTASFDSNMSEIGRTNGAGVYQVTKTYGDANDPFRASQEVNANGNTVSDTWDQYGNCISHISARGTLTTYTMNYGSFALGELTSSQVGSKAAATCTYNEPSGLISSITTPAPGTSGGGATVTTSFTYSALGNLLTETRAGNNAVQTRTITYNYTTDAQYSYNQAEALRQPITRTDELGHVSHCRFDRQANKVAEFDALGNEADFVWNIANNYTIITFPPANMTGSGRANVSCTYLYPGGPAVAESQNNESNIQFWQIAISYGPEGETLYRTGCTQPYSVTLDPLYRIKTAADGLGNLTKYYFNKRGYPDATTYPGYTGPLPSYNSVTDSYDNVAGPDSLRYSSYDAQGNPLQRIDGRGIITNYQYSDAESQLTNVSYPNSSSYNVVLSYDAYSRISAITDGTGSRSFSYDDHGSTTRVTTSYTGLSAQSITYAYYPDGSRKSMTLPDGTGFQYSFDAAGRPAGIVNPSNQTWNWNWSDNNLLMSQNDNNTVNVVRTLNARGFQTELTNSLTSGNTAISDYTVNSYNTSGDVGQITCTLPASAALSGTINYSRDAKRQLLQEQSTRGGPSGYSDIFSYDAAGNAIVTRGVSQSFNSDNQPTSSVYDGDGNPLSRAGQSLAFDVENRMIGYGALLTAGYRGDGLRAWKQTSAGKTYFVYDGIKPILEVDASGNKIAVATFGPNGLLARSTSARTLLYVFDFQGNVAQQVDATSGAVVANYMFDAFGVRAYSSTDTQALSEPYAGFGGMAGYYSDWETGLEVLGYRSYDPTTCRFVNRDPTGVRGGVNLYEYVNNEPISSHDATGLYEGQGGDFGFGCAFGVAWQYIENIYQGHPCGDATACTIAVACVAASICALLGGIMQDMTAAEWAVGGFFGPPLAACLVGAICGIMGGLAPLFCQSLDPCHKEEPLNINQVMCNLFANAISGCIGNILNPLLSPFKGNIVGALGTEVGNIVCNYFFGGGYSLPQ
jgi:RHS repeat-associated protein